MAGKGAPEGNQYAKKGEKGRSMSLYLPGEDLALIRQILQDRGDDSSDEKCIELARIAAMSGIHQLVIAKKSESDPSLETSMRNLVDGLFSMVRSTEGTKSMTQTYQDQVFSALGLTEPDNETEAKAVLATRGFALDHYHYGRNLNYACTDVKLITVHDNGKWVIPASTEDMKVLMRLRLRTHNNVALAEEQAWVETLLERGESDFIQRFESGQI